MNAQKKTKVCIVGGGSAGWITLAYLAATTDLDLTIVYSDEIDIIGVGESTTPTVKYVASTVGIDERTWMKDSKATFKYGVDFINFNRIGSHWFHSFDDLIPRQCFNTPLTHFGKEIFTGDISSVEFFLAKRMIDPTYNIDRFNNTHGCQQFLLENKLSPYNKRDKVNIGEFPGYSYHVNAFEFGKCLKKHTPAHKYKEIVSTVIDINYNDSGIESILLASGQKIEADIFFDCSGMKRVLTKSLTEWTEYTGLPNNSAVFGPIKNLQLFKPATEAIAQEAGWVWVTPTLGQVGTGYVFSDHFISEDNAVQTLRNLWKARGQSWEPSKSIKFNAGRLAEVSCKNVISNGLGQSFIEPLEATSIMVTCVTVILFAKIFNKHKKWSNKSTKAHNTIMVKFLENTKNFVKYHYLLTERTDNDYWRQFKNNTAAQEVSNIIKNNHKAKWVDRGQTLFNKWNWASMLIGYDKPYTGSLPNLCHEEILEYMHYTDLLMYNYKYLIKDNITICEALGRLK